jgi:dTDP-4-dehydrorhamnose reductase
MKILVLGGTGMIGHRMWATLNLLGHDVYATCRSSQINDFLEIPGICLESSILNLNVLDYSKLETVISELKPEIILNCVGIVKQLEESKNELLTIELNSLFPHKLAELCKKYNSRMIQFSTDCVFSGSKGNYKESDPLDVDDLYGRSKILGEIHNEEHVLTIRTSTIGREINPHGGLVEWFISQNGKKIKGFSNAIYSGLPTYTLATYINDFILSNKELNGVYHISSEPINKYSLLTRVKEILNLDVNIIEDKQFVMKRSLNSSKFCEKTNANSPSWDLILKDLLIDETIYNNRQRIKGKK